MGNMKEKIYEKSPHWIQNLIVSLYNILAYKKRYAGDYSHLMKHYHKTAGLSLEELYHVQSEKYSSFLQFAIKNSKYYSNTLGDLALAQNIDNIQSLPVIDKETLRNNAKEIYTINQDEGIISKTGGTTGKSLQVLYTYSDVQERFALLDNFRSNFGYRLGKNTAWFSGKKLLSASDIKKNRFWKTDYIYNVRYYSTFHIHGKYLKFYLENLIKYRPMYMVGFPSTMYEIAKYGMAHSIAFPSDIIKAIFPTAETITSEIREVLEEYFKTNVYNQYASSEGAPFIFECKNKKLHLELQSGVFALIRYDIGDHIELEEGACDCGNNNPLVKEVLGRISDYIYSEEIGKINLGNISNCLKGVTGIIKFQILQHAIDNILVLIEKDDSLFGSQYEKVFLKNLRDRVGQVIHIDLQYVEEIPVEKSGKFRLIKNTIKQAIIKSK